MKAERKNFKGIEYVLFSELPQDQQDKLMQTLSQDVFIKIMIDGVVVSKCIQYHHYQNWFDKVFKAVPSVSLIQKAIAAEKEKLAVKTPTLALKEA